MYSRPMVTSWLRRRNYITVVGMFLSLVILATFGHHSFAVKLTPHHQGVIDLANSPNLDVFLEAVDDNVNEQLGNPSGDDSTGATGTSSEEDDATEAEGGTVNSNRSRSFVEMSPQPHARA